MDTRKVILVILPLALVLINCKSISGQPYVEPAIEPVITQTQNEPLPPVPTAEQAVPTSGQAPYRPQLLVNNSNSIFYLIGLDGSGINLKIPGSQAVWSPDGSRIAYILGDDLTIINADGSNQVNLSKGQEVCRSPQWSPDGTQIFFGCIFTGGNYTDLCMIRSDGSSLTRLTNTPEVGENDPFISPDGTMVAYDSGMPTKLYFMNADGSDARQIANGFRPAWSPDGTLVAFVNATSSTQSDIFVINKDGSGKENLLEKSAIIAAATYHPNWSPDGSKLLFATEFLFTVADIYTINTDGSGLLNLTNTSEINEYVPIWSMDGNQVAFQYNSPGSELYDIFLMNADGTGLTNLTNGLIQYSNYGLGWRPEK